MLCLSMIIWNLKSYVNFFVNFHWNKKVYIFMVLKCYFPRYCISFFHFSVFFHWMRKAHFYDVKVLLSKLSCIPFFVCLFVCNPRKYRANVFLVALSSLHLWSDRGRSCFSHIFFVQNLEEPREHPDIREQKTVSENCHLAGVMAQLYHTV